MFENFAKCAKGLCVALLMGLPVPALAQDTAKAPLVVESPWARASIGTSRPGGAYMILRNEGSEAVSLVGLRTEIAGMSAIHETKTNAEGVSSMSPAGDIVIPAGGTIALEPGGYHAMLMQLQSPLVEGETLPLTLLFSDGSTLDVSVPILGVGARGPKN